MNQEKRKLRNTLIISVDDLRLGMFVAELDRPWSQTPFMLQGFLLTEVLDYQALQSMVGSLVIDPSRSDAASLLHLPWDVLHETVLESENSVKEPVVRISYSTQPSPETASRVIARARQAFTELGGIFTQPEPHSTGIAKNLQRQEPARQGRSTPQPYFLRYDSTPAEVALEDKAERSSRFAPPSSPQFSDFISQIYPRDVIYAPLNFLEKTQDLLRKLRQPTHYSSSRPQRHFSKRRQRPSYVPHNLNLVIYKHETPMQEELKHAKVALARTEAFLTKLASDIKSGQELELEQVRPAVQLLTESVIANPSALIWLIRMQEFNNAIYAHGLKVAVYMMSLGRHLGFAREQLNDLGLIGLLLDLGKLNLPQDLLDKPERLSDKEMAVIHTHVTEGLQTLQKNSALPHNVYLGISQHHERLDASGYPAGIKGQEISIFGRMAAIADSFAAMTSDRNHAISRSAFDAMKELFKEAGKGLHAPLVEEFVQAIGIFPVGSLIELSSGEVAIVLEHNRLRRLEPKILVLTDRKKNMLETGWVLNLMNQVELADHARIRILRGLPDGAYGIDSRRFYQNT